MELRHLRYFVVAAEEEHFHRAAKRLHVVQPALSRQIRMLEDEIGLALFERIPHGVRLSDAGKVFLAGARRILGEIDELVAESKRAEQGQVGTLRIGFNEASARSLIVPQSLNAFRRTIPDVKLNLMLTKSQAQIEAIGNGELDAGFLFDLPRSDKRFSHVAICRMERLLVLPKEHLLAKKRVIRLADLSGEPFILMTRAYQSVPFDRMMSACIAGGLSPRIVQEANDEQTIIHLVSVGMGMSFLISPEQKSLPPTVIVRRVADFLVPMYLDLAWARANSSRALQLFIEIVRKLGKKH